MNLPVLRFMVDARFVVFKMTAVYEFTAAKNHAIADLFTLGFAKINCHNNVQTAYWIEH